MRSSRRELLAAGAGALVLAGPATAGAPSDSDQLAGLLARELRLEAAYADALERGLIEPRLGEQLLAHEREHVRALESLVRGRHTAPAAPPQAGDRRSFARAALGLEAETVDAYVQALTTLRNDRLLQPLGSIMACGAQHEVALRQALDEKLL